MPAINRKQQMLHAITRARELWGLELNMEALEAINRAFSSKVFVPVGRTLRNGVRRIVCFLFYADKKMPGRLGCGFENDCYIPSDDRSARDRATLIGEKRGAQAVAKDAEQNRPSFGAPSLDVQGGFSRCVPVWNQKHLRKRHKKRRWISKLLFDR
jgi:hypothetical protein